MSSMGRANSKDPGPNSGLDLMPGFDACCHTRTRILGRIHPAARLDGCALSPLASTAVLIRNTTICQVAVAVALQPRRVLFITSSRDGVIASRVVFPGVWSQESTRASCRYSVDLTAEDGVFLSRSIPPLRRRPFLKRHRVYTT